MTRRIAMLMLAGSLSLASANSTIAQDFSIRSQITDTCLQNVPKENQSACVGKASQACMSENNGGETTYGMSSCTGLELDWWDAKLNTAYGMLVAREKADDKEMESYQTSGPKKAPALRDMQRAWISYRDRLCEYEASQWGGGTGAGPAFLSCMMAETSRQYFMLNAQMGGPR